MIASAASGPPSSASAATQSSTPLSRFSRGLVSPISPVEQTTTSTGADAEAVGDPLGDRVRGLEALGAGVAVGAAGVEHDRADDAVLDDLLAPQDRVGLAAVGGEDRGGVVVGAGVDDQGDVLAAAGLQAGFDAGSGEAGGVGDAHVLLASPVGVDGDGGDDVVPCRRHSSAARSASPTGTRIQSVSKVEIVKTLISASASGCSSVGEDAGQREVERALDGERRERPGLLAPSSARCAGAQTTLVSQRRRGDREQRRRLGPAGHLGAGAEAHDGELLGELLEGERRSLMGPARRWRGRSARAGRARGSCTARPLRRCPWPGCRRHRRRPSGRPAASSRVTCRCTLLEPVTDLVAGHCPSGSRWTNGSSAYAFS